MARILHNNRVKFSKDFFSIVLYTNMAAMTSSENHLYVISQGSKAEADDITETLIILVITKTE